VLVVPHLKRVTSAAYAPLAGHWIEHVTDQVQRGDLENRIHTGRIGVSDQQHVTLVDQLESTNAGAIKANAFRKQFVAEVFDGD
jgi:hypothetical protein